MGPGRRTPALFALGELLDRLPGGLEERIGEAGWQLSDGEASRVCVARALTRSHWQDLKGLKAVTVSSLTGDAKVPKKLETRLFRLPDSDVSGAFVLADSTHLRTSPVFPAGQPGPPSPAPDVTPPTLSFTAPADGSYSRVPSMAGSDQSGYFRFFDPGNVELTRCKRCSRTAACPTSSSPALPTAAILGSST